MSGLPQEPRQQQAEAAGGQRQRRTSAGGSHLLGRTGLLRLTEQPSSTPASRPATISSGVSTHLLHCVICRSGAIHFNFLPPRQSPNNWCAMVSPLPCLTHPQTNTQTQCRIHPDMQSWRATWVPYTVMHFCRVHSLIQLHHLYALHHSDGLMPDSTSC